MPISEYEFHGVSNSPCLCGNIGTIDGRWCSEECKLRGLIAHGHDLGSAATACGLTQYRARKILGAKKQAPPQKNYCDHCHGCHNTGPCPSLEEIESRAAEVRDAWTIEERQRRALSLEERQRAADAAGRVEPWLPPRIDTRSMRHLLQLEREDMTEPLEALRQHLNDKERELEEREAALQSKPAASGSASTPRYKQTPLRKYHVTALRSFGGADRPFTPMTVEATDRTDAIRQAAKAQGAETCYYQFQAQEVS